MKALVFGSAAYDTLEFSNGERFEGALGGSAVYASLAASFFTVPQLVSVVGYDWNEEFTAKLQARKIDALGLEKRTTEKTFHWIGRYESDMNNRKTIGGDVGVLENAYAPIVPNEYKGTSIVFLGNISPKSSLILLDQLDAPKFVVADTMKLYIQDERDALLELLRRIDGFTLNEEEAETLTGESDPLTSARKILELGPHFVILKLGSRGALWVTRESYDSYPIFETTAVDPTGAGDSFGGAFMGTIAEFDGELSQESIRLACFRATAVASLTVEDVGTKRLERATRDEIDARVAALARQK